LRSGDNYPIWQGNQWTTLEPVPGLLHSYQPSNQTGQQKGG
jgi:hypothetical protein